MGWAIFKCGVCQSFLSTQLVPLCTRRTHQRDSGLGTACGVMGTLLRRGSSRTLGVHIPRAPFCPPSRERLTPPSPSQADPAPVDDRPRTVLAPASLASPASPASPPPASPLPPAPARNTDAGDGDADIVKKLMLLSLIGAGDGGGGGPSAPPLDGDGAPPARGSIRPPPLVPIPPMVGENTNSRSGSIVTARIALSSLVHTGGSSFTLYASTTASPGGLSTVSWVNDWGNRLSVLPLDGEGVPLPSGEILLYDGAARDGPHAFTVPAGTHSIRVLGQACGNGAVAAGFTLLGRLVDKLTVKIGDALARVEGVVSVARWVG